MLNSPLTLFFFSKYNTALASDQLAADCVLQFLRYAFWDNAYIDLIKHHYLYSNLCRSFGWLNRSLEMLAGVGLAEEGILRMLFTAAYLMFGKVGSDADVSAASR